MDCENCDIRRVFQSDDVCWKGKTWDVYWDEESYSSSTTIHGDRPDWVEESAVLVGTFEAECWADMKVKSHLLAREA